ncbi:MAG: VWA domain-containing protein [Epsilonproteobacteria bacterium]|nr:VWA domain-containing protein [Campylobacterota bacterium]
MKFLNFEFIPLMLLPSFLLLYLILTNKSILERIFDPKLLKRLKIEGGLSKKLRLILLFLAFFFMILALARPVYQKGIIEVERYRSDLVIALDISRSMKAKDYYPNRLTFAKRKIEEFIENSSNLQIGLLAFAKDAYIISPITDDKTSLKYLLNKLDTDLLSLKSTNFFSALMSANFLLKKSKDKNLLLVTDGGDQTDFKELIEYAKSNRFKISILAVATKKGAPIEEEGGGFVKDKEGNVVITRLNEKIKELAQATNGVFVQATYTNEDIKTLLKQFQIGTKEAKVEKIVDQVELYPFFLVFALLFLFISFFSIPGKFAFIFLLLSPAITKAGITDFKIIQEATQAYEKGDYKLAAKKFLKLCEEKRSMECYYNAGNALYKAKEYQKAINYYNKIHTDDKELEFKKLHNLGNSYFQLKQYQQAIHYYQEALKIKDDPDTRFNLELAKKMLKNSKQPQQPQQQEQKNKDSKKSKNDSSSSNSEKESSDQGKGSSQTGKQKKEPQPISDREEKKWLKQIQQNNAKTLLYKSPITIDKEGSDENPW